MTGPPSRASGAARPGPDAGSSRPTAPAVDLYWIPLGAGGYVVRSSGKLYEALKALVEHRPRLDLYHSALQIWLPEDRFVIECAAILNLRGEERGVVAGGPVGMRWLGRFRHFRYEIRRWRGGSIPDLSQAVSGPVRVATDVGRARRVLDLAPSVPTPVWGRDELGTGEMWNSNSVISWLLACAGIDTDGLEPPAGGRAPGWNAGLVVAGRRRSSATPRAAGGTPPRCARCHSVGG
jgi:hypothetical protein